MRRNNVIVVLAIIVFFATVSVSNQRVDASGNIPTFNYVPTNDKSNNYGISQGISEGEKSQEYIQTKVTENLKEQAKLDTLEKKIRTFVEGDINKFGMVYYDINTNKTIEINADKQFIAASTVKVPINMLMYDMVQDGEIDINEELKFVKDDFEEGAGILQGMDLSKPVAIKTLSEFSIIYSDNIAINMLLRRVGKESRFSYIEEIVGHPIVYEGNNITAKDYSEILKRLYFNPEGNTYYTSMIETMKKTECHDRIDKYIPREIVAHKMGNFNETVNDTAIVYKDNPYILVVFTDEISDANEVIGQVSKIVYDAQK